MSSVIESSIEIERPPEVVFDYLLDLTHEPLWNPDVESMEKVTEGPLGVGSTFRAKYRGSGVVHVTCTMHERPRRWSYRSSGGPIVVDILVTLAPTSKGTMLTSRFEATPRGFGRLIFPFFMAAMRRKDMPSKRASKRAIESL